jgi:carbon catabolite-derepressing protein kinase
MDRVPDYPIPKSTPDDYVSHPSTVGILPSSIPRVWRQTVAGRAEAAAAASAPSDSGPISDNPQPQNPEAQAATARAIQGQNRSSVSLDTDPALPAALTQIHEAHDGPAEKKQRATKWQFGIRSRNGPHEAMLCIYKALRKFGAAWDMTGFDKYIPDNPFLIHVRWEKTGMADLEPSTSAHVSSTNLAGNIPTTNSLSSEPRRGSATPSVGSTTGSIDSDEGTTTSGSAPVPATKSCYVYIDIQLYSLPNKYYMVDFKLDGYERIEVIDGKKVGMGRCGPDKEVTSPFPYLTMVSDLIIALAEGQD